MTNDSQMVSMGQRIVALRTGMGWSQGALARRLGEAGFAGSHQTTISRIEKAERPVNVFEAYTIADVFGITVDQLVGREQVAPVDGAAGIREAIQILSAELTKRAA